MIADIPLQSIDPNPWQTRQGNPDPAYIQDLAADIAAHGLLQVPLGRIVDGAGRPIRTLDLSIAPETLPAWIAANSARVQLAFGHNRLAAFRLLSQAHLNGLFEIELRPANWLSIPVELRPLADEQMADFAWSENERRRDVDPISRAIAIRQRLESFGWTHAQAGEHTGLSRSAISNLLRLLDLPEPARLAVADGRLSARQADGLLSLYSLPADLLAQADNGYFGQRPAGILKDAIENGISSDEIRRRVTSLCQNHGRMLSGAPWKITAEIPGEGLRSLTCKTCSSRVVDHNLCLDRDCYDRKKRRYERLQIQAISDQTGYSIYDGKLSNYELTGLQYGADKADFAAILKAGCPNLVLVPGAKSTLPTDPPIELDGAELRCSKRNGFCTCLKGLEMQRELARRQQVAPAQPPDGNGNGNGRSLAEVFEDDETPVSEAQTSPGVKELEQLARQARLEKRRVDQHKKALVSAFAQALAAGLATAEVGAFRLLAGKEIGFYDFAPEKTQGLDLNALLLMIAEYVATKALPYDPKSADHILRYFNDTLTRYGMAPIAMPVLDEPAPGPERESDRASEQSRD